MRETHFLFTMYKRIFFAWRAALVRALDACRYQPDAQAKGTMASREMPVSPIHPYADRLFRDNYHHPRSPSLARQAGIRRAGEVELVDAIHSHASRAAPFLPRHPYRSDMRGSRHAKMSL